MFDFLPEEGKITRLRRGILVYNICLISNSVSDGAANKSVLNIERS